MNYYEVRQTKTPREDSYNGVTTTSIAWENETMSYTHLNKTERSHSLRLGWTNHRLASS